MSTLEDLDDMERDEKEQKKDRDDKDKKLNANGDGKDADMKDAEPEKQEEEDYIDMEILNSSTRDIINRRRLLENEMKILKSEFQRLTHEQNTMKDKIKDNLDKIENNRFVLLTGFRSIGTAANMLLDNYRTLSAMSSNFLIWTLRQRPLKRELTSTSTPLVSESPQSLKHLRDRLYSFHSSVLLTTTLLSLEISSV